MPEDISTKKRVGSLDGHSIFEITTTGGFTMVLMAKNGNAETLGAGCHPAIARHIASRSYPDLVFTDLAKGGYVPVSAFEHLLDKYTEVTKHCNELLKKK